MHGQAKGGFSPVVLVGQILATLLMLGAVGLGTAVLRPDASATEKVLGFPPDLLLAWILLVAGLLAFAVSMKSERKAAAKWMPLIVGAAGVLGIFVLMLS